MVQQQTSRWIGDVCVKHDKSDARWNRKSLELPVIPGTLWNSSNIPNPIYNLNKHEFHAQFAHVDFVWAPFSQTLWSLASSLGGARQICGLFIEGWRRLSGPLPSSSPGASKVLHLTCVILLRDWYLPKGPLLRAGFQVATLQTLLVNILNAEQSRILWISKVLVKLISIDFLCCHVGFNDMLQDPCCWRRDFYPLLLQHISHFNLGFGGRGGNFITPFFAFVSAKFVGKATGLLKMMVVRAETSIYQLSVSQAAFKNHYSPIQHMCQGRPAG